MWIKTDISKNGKIREQLPFTLRFQKICLQWLRPLNLMKKVHVHESEVTVTVSGISDMKFDSLHSSRSRFAGHEPNSLKISVTFKNLRKQETFKKYQV